MGDKILSIFGVAPFAGAWIEMLTRSRKNLKQDVAPFAGAWIEILKKQLLSWTAFVAPFAGAWIEIGAER